MLRVEDAPGFTLPSFVAEVNMVFADLLLLFFTRVVGIAGAISIAVSVVISAASAVVLRSPSSSSSSSASPILDVEGLLLPLPKPDGVDVSVVVVEGGCEGRWP